MNKVWQWVSDKFSSFMDLFKKKGIPVSVIVVNVLKDIVNSGVGDVLTSLTKTDLDNKILAQLKIWVPRVAFQLATTEVLIQSGATDAEIIAALVEWLKKQNITVQSTFYAGFAAKLNEMLADGKISFAEGLALSQYLYLNIPRK